MESEVASRGWGSPGGWRMSVGSAGDGTSRVKFEVNVAGTVKQSTGLQAHDSSGLARDTTQKPIDMTVDFDSLDREVKVRQSGSEAGPTGNWTVTKMAYDLNSNLQQRIENRRESPARRVAARKPDDQHPVPNCDVHGLRLSRKTAPEVTLLKSIPRFPRQIGQDRSGLLRCPRRQDPSFRTPDSDVR